MARTAARTKIFSLDHFLGVNEAVDGQAEMVIGEASRLENFTITDGYNLQTRPGIVRMPTTREKARVLATWSGYMQDKEALVVVDFYNGKDRVFIFTQNPDDGSIITEKQEGPLGLSDPETEESYTKIFSYAGHTFIMTVKGTVMYNNGQWEPAKIYVPVISESTAPSGGGGAAQQINLLSNKRKIGFSADGTSTKFVFPEQVRTILKLEIDNAEQDIASKGSLSGDTFTFKEAPIKGVSNVWFEYDVDPAITAESTLMLAKMRLTEAYNGATDTRLFMAGDGVSDKCFYTGVPDSGDLTELYFPALNEARVDMSGSPVTGLTRHYGKLLAFKPDGVYAITYQPLTLEGGKLIASFNVRPVSKGVGHDIMGQLQTVDNCPRSITKGSVYEWKLASMSYSDERNYSVCSGAVRNTLRKADFRRVVTCDDNTTGTYYVCLNDVDGTVLVNRYLLGKKPGLWTIYRSNMFRNVEASVMFAGQPTFIRDGEILRLSPNAASDAPETKGGEAQPIRCLWESGYQAFGNRDMQKYSSLIYLSVRPDFYSDISITAKTDRNVDYSTKSIASGVFSFKNASFSRWTFKTFDNPRARRIRLRAKHFCYYKLIIESNKANVKNTVLSLDQEVFFSAKAR